MRNKKLNLNKGGMTIQIQNLKISLYLIYITIIIQ